MKDITFINIAKIIAEESKCISLRVGAVIVKDDRIISMGYNGTVNGSINCNKAFGKEFDSEHHSEWSDSHEIHAEMNALMFAAKYGVSVNDCTLYCTHEPCDQCLKNIIQSGIERIVYLIPYKKEKCKSKYRFDGSIKIEQFNE